MRRRKTNRTGELVDITSFLEELEDKVHSSEDKTQIRSPAEKQAKLSDNSLHPAMIIDSLRFRLKRNCGSKK
jgi:hypothetical protein